MPNYLWIFFSYLLGSIPFGYIITKLSAKKNILEVGWRKTSASNVFKNIGKWQGILTAIFDIFKGYLAVKISQIFGFSSQIQVFAGLAVLIGHNWSIFLKFAGGRGIGTFVGVLFALNSKILLISLLPSISLALIWNTSIATIFLLIIVIILAINFNQFETIGVFTLISLLPIFIKRLSPIKELSLKNKDLIRNRLIFDNDEACLDLRIKKIIKNLTKS